MPQLKVREIAINGGPGHDNVMGRKDGLAGYLRN